MSLRQDRRRLLGPSGVQKVSLSNSNVPQSLINDANKPDHTGEDEIAIERDVLKNTANSSTIYTLANSSEFLCLLSSMYVKPYKQQFVEKCVINVNFENFIDRGKLATYEHFIQKFLESIIILSEYPKSGLDFFVKNVTASNAVRSNIAKTQPVDLTLLKHITTSIIATLLEANVSIKYWPSVGISKNRNTLVLYIKNETEILSYFSITENDPVHTLTQELEECKEDAIINRTTIRTFF